MDKVLEFLNEMTEKIDLMTDEEYEELQKEERMFRIRIDGIEVGDANKWFADGNGFINNLSEEEKKLYLTKVENLPLGL